MEQRVTAQQEFDSIYITSSEICQELRITRATICSDRRRGLLPDHIAVNGTQLMLWRRNNLQVQSYVDAKKLMLQARRGELTG